MLGIGRARTLGIGGALVAVLLLGGAAQAENAEHAEHAEIYFSLVSLRSQRSLR